MLVTSHQPKAASLADAAYQRIRRMIVRCELSPGFQFSELSIGARLELSKTPVREALGRLVQDGLVRSYPRVGYVVTPITLRDVTQLLEFRVVVEPAAAHLAAGRLSREQETRLQRLMEMSPSAGLDTLGLDEWSSLNREFHMTIAEGTQNDRLVRTIAGGLEEWERLYRLAILLGAPNRTDRHDEHRRIGDAVLAGQAEMAEEIARQHVIGNHEWTTNALVLSASLMEAEISLPGTNTETMATVAAATNPK